MRTFIVATVFSLLLASCGGGGDDDDGGSSGGTNAASTSAMAAAFSTELTKTKECFQGEIDGKGACATVFLSDPVTRMCSDVKTGRESQFAGADYSKFVATCDTWATVLQSPAPEKLTKLTQMIATVDLLK